MKNLSKYVKDVDSLPLEAFDLISELPIGQPVPAKNVEANELETTGKKN